MRTINLAEEKLGLEEIMKLAHQEPLLLLTSNGKKFLITSADTLQPDGETFRVSPAFQKFLNERSGIKTTMEREDLTERPERELGTPKQDPDPSD